MPKCQMPILFLKKLLKHTFSSMSWSLSMALTMQLNRLFRLFCLSWTSIPNFYIWRKMELDQICSWTSFVFAAALFTCSWNWSRLSKIVTAHTNKTHNTAIDSLRLCISLLEQLEFWDLTENGGSQWKVEDMPGDCGFDFCTDGVTKYFVTSFESVFITICVVMHLSAQ